MMSLDLLESAAHMARLAEIGYGHDPTGLSGQVSDSYPLCRLLPLDAGFVVANSRRIVVVFSGTTDAFDWIINLDCKLVEGSGGRVHAGFAHFLQCLWSPLLDGIERLRMGQRELIFVGHSRGGALATLATAALRRTCAESIQVFTFGSPRVGDEQFSINYEV